MLKTATSRYPLFASPSINMLRGPEVVTWRIMYPVLGPIQSRQVLTAGPGFTKLKGPAVPGVQIDALAVHCALAANVQMLSVMESSNVLKKLFNLIMFCQNWIKRI
jgi:hypothetical protein